ncbi:MAG: NAD(P)/FAD-dependent oxidoreductase [Polyangiales bacterium]
MSKLWHYAIVGAGPAGTASALNLLRLGVAADDIVVLDKATFPRPKLCGGGITHRGTALLQELLPGHFASETDVPPGGLRTLGLDFASRAGRFPVQEAGPQWLYDRADLDHALLRAVEDKGVLVLQGTALTKLERATDEWTVHVRGRESGVSELRARWVIGADGAHGAVARCSGIPRGRLGRLVEAYYEATPRAQTTPDRLLFDFDPVFDGIPGYAWIFPYPNSGHFKIGVMDGRGIVSGNKLRSWTDDFAHRHGYRRVDAKIAGWPEHFYAPSNQAHIEGLVLVGEAWGIDPLLGEGIAPSLEMAAYAAERLAGASSRRIRGYERDFRRTTPGRNLLFQHHLANLVYGPHPTRWVRVLFGHEYMRELAGQGTEAYGKLARHLPRLVGDYALQCLKEGLPSARPFPPRNELEMRGRTTTGRA